jgi:hypothetical protein
LAADLISFAAAAASALEESALGEAMRGGPGLYPLANVAHLLGLVMLVGGIGILDLRIIGFGRKLHLATLSQLLTPIAVAGLVILLASGFLLFAADAGPLIDSRVFQLKMILLAVGVANALIFRRWFGDPRRDPTLLARGLALASIGIWLTVGALGRLIAYS